MEKIKIKELVLRFVESKGSAKYTEIQEFIVDHKKGLGTYKSGYQLDKVWLPPSKKNPTGALSAGFPNIYRGYYSSAFSGPYPWFIFGNDYLEKREDGRYIVVRNKPKAKPHYRPWPSLYHEYHERIYYPYR